LEKKATRRAARLLAEGAGGRKDALRRGREPWLPFFGDMGKEGALRGKAM